MFNLVDVKLRGLVYDLLPFRIYWHPFFVGVEIKLQKDVSFVPDFLLTTSTWEVNSIKTFPYGMLTLTTVK